MSDALRRRVEDMHVGAARFGSWTTLVLARYSGHVVIGRDLDVYQE
jgi:hypothetical protein